MVKKLTKTQLEKKLLEMSREELAKIIVEQLSTNKALEEKLNLVIMGDAYGRTLLEKYKKQMYRIFNSSGAVRTGSLLEKADRILDDFLSICGYGRWYGDLALYFAECATDFTMSYGDMNEKFYDSLAKAYEVAVNTACEDESLYKMWKKRIDYVYDELHDFAWGMDIIIPEIYYTLPWIEGESE